jgi:hypothetical protein
VAQLADRIMVMYLGHCGGDRHARCGVGQPGLHPYTRALIRAVPRLDPDAERPSKIVLSGRPAEPDESARRLPFPYPLSGGDRAQLARRPPCVFWLTAARSPAILSPDDNEGRDGMPARTGEQFLKGLKGPRAVWVDGERVSDVVSHPKLCGAAHTPGRDLRPAACRGRDLPHARPETGEPIPVSHMIPRSREDLAKRGGALRKVAEYSVGLMGRTPDYMNVTYAGFAGRPDEWGSHGNEAGARAAGDLSEVPAPQRHLADPHHRAADRRQGDG